MSPEGTTQGYNSDDYHRVGRCGRRAHEEDPRVRPGHAQSPPWAAILANAPALAESARRLVSDTRARRGSPTSTDIATLVDRIAALEQRARETVELIAQLTAQNAALTTATEVLEARVRALMIVATLAAFVAVASLVVVLVS